MIDTRATLITRFTGPAEEDECLFAAFVSPPSTPNQYRHTPLSWRCCFPSSGCSAADAVVSHTKRACPFANELDCSGCTPVSEAAGMM